MQKNIFFAKQGILFRFIGIVFQALLSPVSLFISFILTTIIMGFCEIEFTLLFKIIFAILNVIWIIRNSLVVVSENRIVLRTWIGSKQIIELDNITDLKIISYKELRRVIFNTTSLNPLIANCMAFYIPAGNFITFKNKFGRDVVIGIWNYKKLYEFLNNGLQSIPDNVADFSEKEISKNTKYNKSVKFDRKALYKFFLKMPLNMHIETFFKNFFKTIIYPLFIALFSVWLLSMADVSINKFIGVVLFFIVSIIQYYLTIRVVVDINSKVIKLNMFLSNEKNVIKYDNLFNLDCVHSADLSELLKTNKYDFYILTPYNPNSNDIVKFELSNSTIVALSVNKPQKLYELLRDLENR